MELAALFSAVAGAIREKDGTAAMITAADFPARIRSIPTGGSDITFQQLRITSPAQKTNYCYNSFGMESFDPAGLALEADVTAFSNVIVLPIDLSHVTLEPAGPLTPGTQAVTLTLRFCSQTVSAQQAITVQYRVPSWTELESAELTWEEFESRFLSWTALDPV